MILIFCNERYFLCTLYYLLYTRLLPSLVSVFIVNSDIILVKEVGLLLKEKYPATDHGKA